MKKGTSLIFVTPALFFQFPDPHRKIPALFRYKAGKKEKGDILNFPSLIFVTPALFFQFPDPHRKIPALFRYKAETGHGFYADPAEITRLSALFKY